jgi:cob(I)alamin adenosyltransferase
MEKGLLMVFTGDGKGKTTAALGLAMRAAGHGLKTCFIQFIKGSWKYGELEAVKRHRDEIDFYVMGRGFTWESKHPEKDREEARRAWQFAQWAMTCSRYHLVVLDEFTYLPNYGFIDLQSAVRVLESRPQGLHVAVTGRNAPKELLAVSDLITEMREIKHPFRVGIKAQKGIEF